jgi:hypothetical protein
LVESTGLVSPLSPKSWSDYQDPQRLIHAAQDNRNWIDLDILSPKLLHEFRRQHALPSEEPATTLAKSAARINAWARQSKRGIDIRLRRKIDEKYAEVTDFHLVSNSAEYNDIEKYIMVDDSEVFEMPGQSAVIVELDDTSTTSELLSEFYDPPSRSSTQTTLPRYDPRADIQPLVSHVPELGEYGALPRSNQATTAHAAVASCKLLGEDYRFAM